MFNRVFTDTEIKALFKPNRALSLNEVARHMGVIVRSERTGKLTKEGGRLKEALKAADWLDSTPPRSRRTVFWLKEN